MREDVRANGNELLHCSFISQPKGGWGNRHEKIVQCKEEQFIVVHQ